MESEVDITMAIGQDHLSRCPRRQADWGEPPRLGGSLGTRHPGGML